MKYQFFDLQKTIASIVSEDPYMISTDPASYLPETKKFHQIYEEIMDNDISIEDLPFYKNYLGKFDLKDSFGDFRLLLPASCCELMNDADFDLLQRFIYGSFSNTYRFIVDETAKTFELSIRVDSRMKHLTVSLHCLSSYQVIRLFKIYLKEQLNWECNIASVENKNEIEKERERQLILFEMTANASFARHTSADTLEELDSILSTPKNDDNPDVFTTYELGETFGVKDVKFKMIDVKGGSFQMGCDDNTAEEDEFPVHTVKVNSFKIGETPVTQALWKEVMGDNPSYFRSGNPEETFDDDLERPVEQVSWEDCQQFLSKLNEITGHKFRLPTEAEWEFAARGGIKSQGHRFAGSDNLDEVAWYWKNSGNTTLDGEDDFVDWNQMIPNQCRTHAVKSKVPNELGIYDMSGNVWEWCLDQYDVYDFLPQKNPKNLTKGFSHVLRGGSWGSGSGLCRVSNRHKDAPNNNYYLNGLRLCLPIDNKTNIHFIIKDDENIADVPELQGYSESQLTEAKNSIQQEFDEAADRVLSEALGLPLPSTIVLKFRHKSDKSNSKNIYAELHTELSEPSHLVLSIYSPLVKEVLENPDNNMVKFIVSQLMFFAADLNIISQESELIEMLENDENEDPTELKERAALMGVLNMCIHYREIGISGLGSCLLTKRKTSVPVVDALKNFAQVFEMVMIKAKLWVEKNDNNDNEFFDETAWNNSFLTASSVLLLVLEKCGLVDNVLAIKALKCLNSGEYDLTDAETTSIAKAALSVSLSDYILGLMMLGDAIAPIQPFLKFCASLCNSYNRNNSEAFNRLVHQPATGQAFNNTISQIVDNMLTDDQIRQHYQDFCKKTDSTDQSSIKEKVEELYSVWEEEKDNDRKQIAQWALTYLFNDKDILHDNVQVFGYMDDMLIVNNALNIIFSDIFKSSKEK